ncbi:MAG: stage V sporulation protein AD [bacterium]|nr:stage V sporulation protein AD [bacterium]
MSKKIGKQTILLDSEISVLSYASVVGKKEGEGPLKNSFDSIYNDELLGEDSFEKAESKLQKLSVTAALQKSKLTEKNIDLIFAGDLLNQCIGSSFGLKDLEIPFVGMYGACSTMALSTIMAALAIESGAAEKTVSVTSSHFCSAERQFRFPLEYGGQRTPTSQWTVTGSGAIILSKENGSPKIKAVSIGKMIDLNVKDMNNMGAAMAPAAADTIYNFLLDTKTTAKDYDLILTGDLGVVGSELLNQIMIRENMPISNLHNDCGLMIYDLKSQDVHAGGSGCGCSAAVLCSEILTKMRIGKYKNILFCATGALMSPTSSLQGGSIPSIAHVVNFQA